MAGVVRLDGSVVDGAGPLRSEGIARRLTELSAMNDVGRLKALCIVHVNQEGLTGTSWFWPDVTGEFPWYLAMHGALALLRAEMEKQFVDSPEIPDPPVIR